MRDHWDGPLYIKGLLDAEDAEIAVNLGARASWSRTTEAASWTGPWQRWTRCRRWRTGVGDRAEVLLDGGVRRGS